MIRYLRTRNGVGALPLVIILVVALAAALFLYRSWRSGTEGGAGREGPGSPATGPQKAVAAPPFTLKDISGNVYASSGFAGKPTVINFFATWCPPCREEIPGFNEVYRRHRERGFELIGIALDTDTLDALPGFLAAQRIEYRILIGDLAVAKAYFGVSTIPTTFFVGKDGMIRNVVVGYIGQEDFDREVRKLL
ncbi:MAG: redoxin domain-containing protein [Thermodesulfobacteriota bacterium]